MKLDKVDKIFIAFICVIVTIFNIGTLVFASEGDIEDTREQVYFQVLEDCVLGGNQTIVSNSTFDLYYLELEKGYTYYISLDYINDSRIGFSDSIAVGSNIYNFTRFTSDGHVDLTVNADYSNYLFFDYSLSYQEPTYTIYREQNKGFDGVVVGLVNNVGFNQLWGVFENGIDFVGVVVLVAFGIFLVVLAIKKISKGKGEF